MLYSMLRSIEIRRMQWSFIDFEDKTIKFPIAQKNQKRKAKPRKDNQKPYSHCAICQLLELLIERKY